MSWLKSRHFISFHSPSSSPNPCLPRPMILFSYPTKKSNVKALSAPVNQEGCNWEVLGGHECQFQAIFSKWGPALRRVACVICSLNKEAESGFHSRTMKPNWKEGDPEDSEHTGTALWGSPLWHKEGMIVSLKVWFIYQLLLGLVYPITCWQMRTGRPVCRSRERWN